MRDLKVKIRTAIVKLVLSAIIFGISSFILGRLLLEEAPFKMIETLAIATLPISIIVTCRTFDQKGLKNFLKNGVFSLVIWILFVNVVHSPFNMFDPEFGLGYDDQYVDGGEYQPGGNDYDSGSTGNNADNTGTNTGNNTGNNTGTGNNAGDDYDSGSSLGSDSLNMSGFTYQLSEINNLDGYFCLNTSKGTLTQAPQEMQYEDWNREVAELNDQLLEDPLFLGYTDFAPLVVDRSKGEQLVLVGDAWDRRAETRKSIMECRRCYLWGYGNPYLLPQDMSISDFEEVEGIDLTVFNKHTDEINKALENTPFEFYDYTAHYGPLFGSYVPQNPKIAEGYPLFLSKTYGETFTYGSYSGTEFIEQNVAMITPYFWEKQHEEFTQIPIEKTKDGYMIVDVSSLEAGYWMFNEQYPIYIK